MIKTDSTSALRILVIIIMTCILSACGRTTVKNSVPASKPYACDWESQIPADGSVVEAGSEFDITWNLLNAGTSEWTTDFGLRYFGGINLTKPGKSRYNLPAPVAPDTVGKCSLDAVAPWEPGEYTMIVVLSDENDNNFCKMDITVKVE